MEKKLTEKEIEILVHNKNVYLKELNANFFKQFKQGRKKQWKN